MYVSILETDIGHSMWVVWVFESGHQTGRHPTERTHKQNVY